MNIIRDGIMLAVYTFSILLAFIFLSNPLALMISSIGAASDAPQMPAIQAEVRTVFSIVCAMAILIPTIIFVWLAFTTNQEEYQY
jgi:sorbitol-specific phosphotransferase system component IIC